MGGLREELPWRHDPERQPRAPVHPASEVRRVARHEVGGVGNDRRREEGPILRRYVRRRQPLDVAGRRLSGDLNGGKASAQDGQRRRSLSLEIPLGLDDRKGRGQERDAAGCSQLDQQRREAVRAICGGEENVGVKEDTEFSHDRDGARSASSPPAAERRPLTRIGAIRLDQSLDLLAGIECDRSHRSGIQNNPPGLLPQQQNRAGASRRRARTGLGKVIWPLGETIKAIGVLGVREAIDPPPESC